MAEGDFSVDLADLAAAINGMRGMMPHVWDDIGGMFTCSEADAVVELFRALGLGGHALALEDAHAEGDEEDDKHYRHQPKEATA